MAPTLPTIKIQGKEYVQVKDRVAYFNDTYTNGSIQTILLTEAASDKIVIQAQVRPDVDGKRVFVGHSQAVVGQGSINKTAALENAETSAVGRALALMGIGVIESVSSADEIHKARPQTYPNPVNRTAPEDP